ncbi:MAG: GGDEF domain-containing protein [Planctomycetes bacterium]|nr:GGDEF domain-containing protein [Planctomycetota bacterium]
MTKVAAGVAVEASRSELEQQIRARIASLSYLPTAAAVAMKFVELGKNPHAEPLDYAKVIGADSSLSSKLLALANSSWAGVRNKVTNVRMAVNLLGLGTVRTLGISYCMTGLHSELRLSTDESKLFWQASLCKAVAAKQYASLLEPRLGDEAFVIGLFQDFAVTVMYATAREPLLAILQDPNMDVPAQLQRERELFNLSHPEAGRLLAQKLELPELFVDAVAFHHDYEQAIEHIDQKHLRDAAHAASLLPHLLNFWSRENADALSEFLQQHAPSTDLSGYLALVEREFTQLFSFFHEGALPDAQLTELLEATAREAADQAGVLVGRVGVLTRSVAAMSTEMHRLTKELEDEVTHDRTTGVLARAGFMPRAYVQLTQAARYGTSFGLVYLDLDRFKHANDTYGHEFGDQALQTLTAALQDRLPEGALIARMAGDEFVVLLADCTEQRATELVRQLVSTVATTPVPWDGASHQLTISAGLLHLRPSGHVQDLETLLNAAAKLMYVAKRAGGNRAEIRSIRPD